VALTIAAAAVATWFLTDAADAWMPNVATTAVGVAATITVVEWVVRREARERLKPRTDRALYWIGLELRMFMESVLMDYAETHRHTYRPIPADVGEMIDQWNADHDVEDNPREYIEHGGTRAPLIVTEAIKLAQRLDQARSRDLDVLEPGLVRGIDDFGWAAAQGLQLCALAQADWNTPPNDPRPVAAKLIVDYFQRFANAYFEAGDPGWREIVDLSRRGNDSYHAHLFAERPQ
jgi:hypothetical protein